VAAAVLETFGSLSTEPRRVGKPLHFELEGFWSARRGPFRVVYRVEEDQRLVVVIAIDHRAHIYRRARKK